MLSSDRDRSAEATPRLLTALPEVADPTGTCRTPAIYAERVTANVRPCIEVAGNELRTSVLVSATAPTPEVTVHVWLQDAVERTARKKTLRTCRVTAGQSALCGPFVVAAEKNRMYSTAVSVEYGTSETPVVWEDAKVTGVQSPSPHWRTRATH